MKRNPNPYVVVLNPGTDQEDIWSDHATHAQAIKGLMDAKDAGESADILKRLDDGTLTTEF